MAEAEGRLQSVEQGLQVAATEILQLKATLQKEGLVELEAPTLTPTADKTEVLKKQFLELKATLDLVKNAAENMKKLQVQYPKKIWILTRKRTALMASKTSCWAGKSSGKKFVCL